MHTTFKFSAIASAITTILFTSGCGSLQPTVTNLEATTSRTIVEQQEKTTQPIPVVTTTPGAWLMGQSIQVMPTPSPILTRVITYHPTQWVSLSDMATWINQLTGLIVDTAEVQGVGNSTQTSGQGASPGMPSGVPMGGMPGMIVPPLSSSPAPVMGQAVGQNFQANPQLLSISYEGPLSGLLDDAANKAGVWWKFSGGRIVFYRTETRTFYLPAIALKSSGSSLISTNVGSGGGSGVGSSGASTNSGGSSSSSGYLVDVWGELDKTAKTVGGGAQIAINASMGSLTVTGTPSQVHNVEEWVKVLTDNLSQQVAITVNIYNVKVTNEDNYNWNPSVVFKTLGTGVALTGPQVPATLAGLAPLNLAVNVLNPASNYTGSQLAFQALSTLGNVTETMRETVVTLNGQPAPMQLANQLSYLASTTPGSAASTTSSVPVPPTLTPGQITTGFTAMFLPRIVNGKIFLAMNLNNSSLIGMGQAGTGTSFIQTPNVDTSTFPQNVMLTPGDSLLLTGIQLDSGNSNQSGVGSPNNHLLGGGVANRVGKKMVAIVITAKVL